MPSVESEVEKPAAQGEAMEITVSRQDLVKELTATQSVVERKTTIPILSNFFIEAESDRLKLTATDLDQAIRTSAAVKVKKPGACTIPARKLYDYIKLLPEGEISIKLLENHWVQIRRAGRTRKWSAWRAPTTRRFPSFPPSRRPAFPRCAEDADRAHHFCHLERRIAVHTQRRAAGDQGRVAGDGGDGWAPAVVCREDERDA